MDTVPLIPSIRMVRLVRYYGYGNKRKMITNITNPHNTGSATVSATGQCPCPWNQLIISQHWMTIGYQWQCYRVCYSECDVDTEYTYRR